MATRKPPAEPDETADPQDDPGAEHGSDPVPAAVARVGEYLDETPRTYQWPDGPQTLERGDVVLVPEGFDDGRFASSAKKPTRLRDNHPDQRPVTAAAQTKARAKAHPDLAEKQSGKGEQR
jgi:hypothetical protein